MVSIHHLPLKQHFHTYLPTYVSTATQFLHTLHYIQAYTQYMRSRGTLIQVLWLVRSLGVADLVAKFLHQIRDTYHPLHLPD